MRSSIHNADKPAAKVGRPSTHRIVHADPDRPPRKAIGTDPEEADLYHRADDPPTERTISPRDTLLLLLTFFAGPLLFLLAAGAIWYWALGH